MNAKELYDLAEGVEKLEKYAKNQRSILDKAIETVLGDLWFGRDGNGYYFQKWQGNNTEIYSRYYATQIDGLKAYADEAIEWVA